MCLAEEQEIREAATLKPVMAEQVLNKNLMTA